MSDKVKKKHRPHITAARAQCCRNTLLKYGIDAKYEWIRNELLPKCRDVQFLENLKAYKAADTLDTHDSDLLMDAFLDAVMLKSIRVPDDPAVQWDEDEERYWYWPMNGSSSEYRTMFYRTLRASSVLMSEQFLFPIA